MRIPGFILAAFVWLATGPLLAAPVETGNTTVDLVSDMAAIAPGEPFTVALKITPREGWHTYWRNPGDSGLATTIEWTLPEGFAAGEIQWPAPHAVPYGPLVNYGYSDEHWLLVRIVPPAEIQPGTAAELVARADWLVCEDICIPEGADLSLVLPVRGESMGNPATGGGFRAARKAIPAPYEGEVAYRLEDGTIVLRLDARQAPPGLGEALRLFPYSETLISNSDPQTALQDGESLLLVAVRGRGEPTGPVEGVLTYGGDSGHGAIAFTAVPGEFDVSAAGDPGAGGSTGAGSPSSSSAPSSGSLDIGIGEALLLAFLGGLLLNLMPCVFPVLSLKALAVVESANLSAAQKRQEGFAYTAGVIASFLAVAGALLAFRAGGEAVGWGFQLQAPEFIAVLAILLFAVGLNLSGYVEFGSRFMGVGQGLVDRGGWRGAFFTGVLATVVATPCTAPFMAPALGFALLQPALVALAIFVALGLGLAAPFLFISLVPAIGRILPRPGPWMEKFRQFLAFPMYATVIWLIWVLGQQAGMNAVAAVLAAIVLVPFAIWAWRAAPGLGRSLGRVASVAAIAGMAWLVVFAGAQEGGANTGTPDGALPHETYDPAVLDDYRAAGEPVFVNFTAAWCITCLANERVALSTADVAAHFRDAGIRYLKGDWTRRDPVITEALTSFGRSGVPLYLYYPAGGGDPVVLPQLLTPGIVLETLRDADSAVLAQGNEGG